MTRDGLRLRAAPWNAAFCRNPAPPRRAWRDQSPPRRRRPSSTRRAPAASGLASPIAASGGRMRRLCRWAPRRPSGGKASRFASLRVRLFAAAPACVQTSMSCNTPCPLRRHAKNAAGRPARRSRKAACHGREMSALPFASIFEAASRIWPYVIDARCQPCRSPRHLWLYGGAAALVTRKAKGASRYTA